MLFLHTQKVCLAQKRWAEHTRFVVFIIQHQIMKIRINNIGPVEEATIDLSKKLTVFCGPNNTGKTYISYLIYVLTKTILKSEIKIGEEQLSELLLDGNVTIPLNYDEVVRLRAKAMDYASGQLAKIFGLADSKVEQYFNDFKMKFVTSDEEHRVCIDQEEMTITTSNSDGLIIDVKKEKNGEKLTLILDTVKSVTKDEVRDFVNLGMFDGVYHFLSLLPITQSYMFPVERVSIQTFHRQLSLKNEQVIGEVVNNSEKIAVVTRPVPARYPIAVKDSLEIADNMTNIQNSKGSFADIADELETTLLNGKLSIDESGEAEFRADGMDNKPLPIQMTASVVKSLSSLVFFLRHQADINHLIIIDEPELNLHPDSQILLARMFGKMIQRGLRLLISTHSDYIVRELNNLIMLSASPSEVMEEVDKYGYKADMLISHNDVSAYLFLKNESGRVSMTPIEMTSEGFAVETIDSAILHQNASAQLIYHCMTE